MIEGMPMVTENVVCLTMTNTMVCYLSTTK